MKKKLLRFVSCCLILMICFTVTLGATYTEIQQNRSLDHLAMPDGIINIQNKYNSLYISDYDYYSVILEDEESITNNEEKWAIFNVNGYSVIKNLKSGNVLTAPTSVSGNVALETYSTSNNRQLWKFTPSEYGTFMISPAVYSYGSGDYVLSFNENLGFYGYELCLKLYSGNYDSRDRWNIVFYDALLLGIPDYSEGHDHYTWMEGASNWLLQRPMFSVSCYTNVYNTSKKDDYLIYMGGARLFAFRGHGGSYPSTNTTSMVLRMPTASSLLIEIESNELYHFGANQALVDMDDCNVALFVACNTAGYTIRDYSGQVTERVVLSQSLPIAAVRAGAYYGIGFTDTIDCGAANYWTESFFKYYAYSSAADAAQIALGDAIAEYGINNNITSMYVYH